MKPVCPRCKSVNIERIYDENKKLFWMIIDLIVGNEEKYKCKNCEYKFHKGG